MDFSEETLENSFEISKICNWVRENNFRKVCLQFPEHLLPVSVQISFKLQEILEIPIYIIADSNYESCCLDYLSAEHVNADAIVHFGPVCFSKQEVKIPFLYIFEKCDISIENLKENLENLLAKQSENRTESFQENPQIFLLIDTPYLHKYNEILEEFLKNVTISRMDSKIDFENRGLYVYVGTNLKKLENVYFSLENQSPLYCYDPSKSEITSFEVEPRLMKRRNFLREIIKDGTVFGLLVATVAVENTLKILEKLKKLLRKKGKKFYVISVGRISVEKLANFPEINVYVLIGCSMNAIFEKEREFFAPIVTPSDVIFALQKLDGSEFSKFFYDFNALFHEKYEEKKDDCEDESPDISLISGQMRHNLAVSTEEETSGNDGKEITLKTSQQLVESSHFLSERSWKGLEVNLEKNEPKKFTEGRSGLAEKYTNEPE